MNVFDRGILIKINRICPNHFVIFVDKSIHTIVDVKNIIKTIKNSKLTTLWRKKHDRSF